MKIWYIKYLINQNRTTIAMLNAYLDSLMKKVFR